MRSALAKKRAAERPVAIVGFCEVGIPPCIPADARLMLMLG
jgi:hypothetical protein